MQVAASVPGPKKQAGRRTILSALVAVVTLAFGALWFTPGASALTNVNGGNGDYWDVVDSSLGSSGTGAVKTGGNSNALDGFGYLRAKVTDQDGEVLIDNQRLDEFELVFDGTEGFYTTRGLNLAGIDTRRTIFIARNGNWLRYLDAFTNRTTEPLTIEVAWGGSMARDLNAPAEVAASSDGNLTLDPSTDRWVTFMKNGQGVADPSQGPSTNGPAGQLFTDGSLVPRLGDAEFDPFDQPYPGRENGFLAYVYTLELAPGETKSLANFLIKGLAESSGNSQIQNVINRATSLMSSPIWTGLPNSARCSIVNFDPQVGTPNLPAGYWNSYCLNQPPLDPVTPPVEKPDLGTSSTYPVVEKSVAELSADMASGETTSEEITKAYLDRIAAYNNDGPMLKAFIRVNKHALEEARQLDAERAAGHVRGPLHGIPIAIKDNIDAKGMPSFNGALSVPEWEASRDTYQMGKLREAGVVLLGKTNMDEWASSGTFSVSGRGGTVRNPYALDRAPGGSSGGSGVATAASLAAFTLGTDNYSSTRHPAGHNNAVTMLATRELSPNNSMTPASANQNHIAPIARSVSDLALALDETIGTDPGDPESLLSDEMRPESYADLLVTGGLEGKTLGVIRTAVDFGGNNGCASSTGAITDRQAAVFDQAVEDLEAQGAEVKEIDVTADFCDLINYAGDQGAIYNQQTVDYIALEPNYPFDYEGYRLARGSKPTRFPSTPAAAPDPAFAASVQDQVMANRMAYRAAAEAMMDMNGVDAMIVDHPNATLPINDSPRAPGRTLLGPGSLAGMPEIVVPAGLDSDGLPVGLAFIGRAFSDADLVRMAYDYEQGNPHRVIPATTPELTLASKPDDVPDLPPEIDPDEPDVPTPPELSPEDCGAPAVSFTALKFGGKKMKKGVQMGKGWVRVTGKARDRRCKGDALKPVKRVKIAIAKIEPDNTCRFLQKRGGRFSASVACDSAGGWRSAKLFGKKGATSKAWRHVRLARLAPGDYQVAVSATDRAGNTSRPKRFRFKVADRTGRVSLGMRKATPTDIG